MTQRALASRLRTETATIARAVVEAGQSRLVWRTIDEVFDPIIAGRGGRATVVDGRGNKSFNVRWFGHRPVVGQLALCEWPPPGGTRRIVEVDRELASSPPAVDGNNDLPIYSTAKFGAKGNGATDDTQALNNALITIGEAGGGQLIGVPGSTYLCEGPLSVEYSGVDFNLNNATLKRVGTSTSSLVRIQTKGPTSYAPDGDPNKIRRSGVRNGVIDGGEAAAQGVHIKSANYAFLERLQIQGGTAFQVLMDCWDVRPSGGDPRDTQQCALRDLDLVATGAGATGVGDEGGLRLNGSADAVVATGSGGNSSLNILENVFVHHYNGVAYQFGNSDGNESYHLRSIRAPTNPFTGLASNGTGMDLLGFSTLGHGGARSNQFHGVQLGNGAALIAHNGTQVSHDNIIFGLSTGNGAVLPTIQAGAGLKYICDDGTSNL